MELLRRAGQHSGRAVACRAVLCSAVPCCRLPYLDTCPGGGVVASDSQLHRYSTVRTYMCRWAVASHSATTRKLPGTISGRTRAPIALAPSTTRPFHVGRARPFRRPWPLCPYPHPHHRPRLHPHTLPHLHQVARADGAAPLRQDVHARPQARLPVGRHHRILAVGLAQQHSQAAGHAHQEGRRREGEGERREQATRDGERQGQRQEQAGRRRHPARRRPHGQPPPQAQPQAIPAGLPTAGREVVPCRRREYHQLSSCSTPPLTPASGS